MTNPAQPRGTPSKRRGASLTDFEQLLNLNSTKAPSTADIPDTAEAVIYLRVSTTRQMNTAIDIDEDGNSIATQREATIRRCRQLKAPISKEFVEPGNSAQSIAKRPQFKQLLHYVEEHTEVGYVVIYMRSRAFRNLTDAAITKRILASMGVKLVSAKEEFGEGYMADAMEAITDIMNEVQVRQSGEDVANKMYHKAKNGGTTGRAKLGYLNVRKEIEGRLVNTIAVDPQRAPLIQWAFEQYATGEYSLVRLLQELTDQGLTTRRTAKYPEQPVSRSKLASMFRDPYYIGMVTFKGEMFTGRHEALISPELFQRVQEVMDARMRRTQRDIVHNHFLRGILLCGRCHANGRIHQLIYSQNTNSHGTTYEYYLCRGRQERECNLPYLQASHLEEAIRQEVATLQLTNDQAIHLRQEVHDRLDRQLASTHETHARLKKELSALDTKEERLLDLAVDNTLPTDKLRERIGEIKVRRASIQYQLDRTDSYLQQETDTILAYIDLLEYPVEFYDTASPELKRKLLAAFYTNIWIDDDGQTPQPQPEQREIVQKIHSATKVTHLEETSDKKPTEQNEKSTGENSDALSTQSNNLFIDLACSSKVSMVRARRFELPRA